MPAPESPASPKAELARLDELAFYQNNPRTHSDAQVEQIIASMVKFGWTNPILADRNGIVAGHGRAEAARRLYAVATPIRLPSGVELPLGYVPVIDCTGWSPEDRRAYILADNQLALNAGWDMTLLRGEILALSEGGFDIGVLGFDEDFLSGLLVDQTVGLTDPDAAPPLPEVAITEAGDVWLLGTHRLVCGDSTDPATVAAALAGEKPGLMVTDPPYGVEYDPAWRSRAGISAEVGPAHGKVMNDHRDDWREAWALFPGNVAYVWHSGLHAATVAQSLEACKFRLRAQIVWVKTRPVIGRGNYHWQHEPALYAVQDETDDGWRFVPEHEISAYAVREGATAGYLGNRKQSTVWFIEHLKSDTGHGTQKPVECMRRPIENNAKPGAHIYDPFLGSGTTLIAAEMTGRVCHGCELSPNYCDVIVQRWEAFTGRKAQRIPAKSDAPDIEFASIVAPKSEEEAAA